FTNLTQDHLDYHETMDKYMQAKSFCSASLEIPMMAKKKQRF
ncbi:Mur ligase family protein, partial [Sinobaca sp. H24]